MNNKIYVENIIRLCNGKLVQGNMKQECVDFCKDSREVKKGDTYIGIKGENFNGSDFYEMAIEKGASVCILQDVIIEKKYEHISIILVDNVIEAIQKLAKYKRSLYNIPVVAITGSVGKTSTKDIVASVVGMKYDVLKTEGNLNNHIGLPLTILKLKEHTAMVVEMGMSGFGEIRLLSNIAKPTVAVITNIGTAHIGKLGTRENILKAKLEILEGLQENGIVILNNDNDLLNAWAKGNSKKIVTYGIEEKSQIMPQNIKMDCECTKYEVVENEEKNLITVPVGGNHFVYNSLCAIAVGKALNIDIKVISQGIEHFQLSKNRMEVSEINGIKIINDCYNANYDSMKAGIEYLKQINAKRSIAILGDMLELGEYSEELHRKVGTAVTKNCIDILITVGEESKKIAEEAKKSGMKSERIYTYSKNSEAIAKINELKESGDSILIKASNGMKFKEIVEALTK